MSTIRHPSLNGLRGLPHLDEEDTAALAALFSRRLEMRRRAMLVRQNEPCEVIKVVMDGFAVRTKSKPDGARQIVGLVTSGQFCNLASLVFDRHDHAVETVTDCEVAVARKADVAAMMRYRPSLGRFLLATSVAATAIASEWILNVGRRAAHERIAHLVCEIFVCNRDLGRPKSCSFPLTQEQLADATGLSVVQVNRSLQRLRASGLIALRHRVLTVLDFDRLALEADFDSSYLYGQREAVPFSRRPERAPAAGFAASA